MTFCHAAQCAVQKHKGIWQSDLSSAATEQKDNRAAVLRLTPLMTPRVWCSRLLMSCHTWDQPPSSHWYLHALTAPQTAATKPCKLILYSCSFYYSLRSFECTFIWLTIVLFFFSCQFLELGCEFFSCSDDAIGWTLLCISNSIMSLLLSNQNARFKEPYSELRKSGLFYSFQHETQSGVLLFNAAWAEHRHWQIHSWCLIWRHHLVCSV